MQGEVIKRALRAAATHNCICYGDCFETRNGMMNGPCEAELGPTAAAIAAFLEAMGENEEWLLEHLAAAVRRAAGGECDEARQKIRSER